jgi:hypothetical protein
LGQRQPWPRPAHRIPARRAPTRLGFRVLRAVTVSECHRGHPCRTARRTGRHPRRHRHCALPRGGPSDMTSLHRSRYRPPYGDMICKRRRAGYGEDAVSFYGRTLPSLRHHEKTSGRLAPATNDEFGGTRPRLKDRPNGNWNYGQDHEQSPPSGSDHH